MVYWFGVRVALGAHLGAVCALGGRRLIEGLEEAVAHSNLAVLPCLLVSLGVKVGRGDDGRLVDSASGLWKLEEQTGVGVHQRHTWTFRPNSANPRIPCAMCPLPR